MNSANLSLYEKIKYDIIEKINSGFYGDDEKIPSETQLMKLYSVSRITASKALVELSLEGYVNRLQGKGTFVVPKNKRVTNYQSNDIVSDTTFEKKTKKIGIIIPDNYDYHSCNIIKAITTNLTFPDYFCNFVISRCFELEDYSIKYFKNNGYNAIILFPVDAEYYNETILELHLNKFPMVILDRVLPGINLNYVICDNFEASKLATEYLIKLGHRKICFVSNASPNETITAKRHEYFVNTLISNKIPIDCSSYFQIFNNEQFEKEFIYNVLQGNITAVIAGNASSAEEIYRICTKYKLKIPEDLSLISFDKTTCSNIDITYIEQGSYEMGVNASEIIKKLLNNINKQEPYKCILKPKLIVINSTLNIQ